MTDSVERRIQFYTVEPADVDVEWKRADVLRGLKALRGDDRVMPLGEDQYAWVEVDRIPRGRETGRLRFFRDRRSNLPGVAHEFQPGDLPIPDGAGIIEPMHVVLASNGLIAAEYNHFAPRIHTHFARLLHSRLGLNVNVGTYVQGSVLEQLDRLGYIHQLEASIVPTPGLGNELRNAGPFGEAAAALADDSDGRRVYLRLSADRGSEGWSRNARRFVKHALGIDSSEHVNKILRVTGHDPITGDDATVDLLSEKLVRRVDFPKSGPRSKVLDKTAAYVHIEEAITEVRATDLRTAAIVWP